MYKTSSECCMHRDRSLLEFKAIPIPSVTYSIRAMDSFQVFETPTLVSPGPTPQHAWYRHPSYLRAQRTHTPAPSAKRQERLTTRRL